MNSTHGSKDSSSPPGTDLRMAIAPYGGPHSNRLLAALSEAEWQRLRAQLQAVELSQGQVLIDAGRVPSHVYFPTTASVSLLSTTRAGDSAELAEVGNEGMVGIPVVMGGGSTLSEAVVKTSGLAVRLSRFAIKEEFDRGGAVMQVLLRYTQALMTHLAQTAACNRHHSVDQRLCRCLLDSADRAPEQDLAMTQESLALCLGVRRESVTVSAQKLQRDGVIERTRGRITVLSRSALEARSCECYALVRREYDRLLPDDMAAQPTLAAPARRTTVDRPRLPPVAAVQAALRSRVAA